MSTSATPTLNLRPVSRPSSKPVPHVSLLKPWTFDYAPSPDGKDLNLLIMFHGLGDNRKPFAALAKSLNLPSTAVLSLQGPLAIPLMETPDYWSWYQTFDPYFNPLPSPSPERTLPPLRELLAALTSPALGWELHHIHLFGWGQGGSMALELAMDVGKSGVMAGDTPRTRLGSVVSVCGPPLSSSSASSTTPCAYFTRLAPASSIHQKQLKALEGFAEREVIRGQGSGDHMPRGKDEWIGIMRFWGKHLFKDDAWKGEGEVYEVAR